MGKCSLISQEEKDSRVINEWETVGHEAQCHSWLIEGQAYISSHAKDSIWRSTFLRESTVSSLSVEERSWRRISRSKGNRIRKIKAIRDGEESKTIRILICRGKAGGREPREWSASLETDSEGTCNKSLYLLCPSNTVIESSFHMFFHFSQIIH